MIQTLALVSYWTVLLPYQLARRLCCVNSELKLTMSYLALQSQIPYQGQSKKLWHLVLLPPTYRNVQTHRDFLSRHLLQSVFVLQTFLLLRSLQWRFYPILFWPRTLRASLQVSIPISLPFPVAVPLWLHTSLVPQKFDIGLPQFSFILQLFFLRVSVTGICGSWSPFFWEISAPYQND